MRLTVNLTLKKRKKIKLDRKGRKTIRAAEWVDQELIDNIRLRNRINKKWRFARKNKLLKEVQGEYKKKNEIQKKITSVMAGEKKSNWERKKIEETWKDGKMFWGMIRELLGMKKEEEDEAYVQADEGERKEVMEIPEKFIGSWLINIYQKSVSQTSPSGMTKGEPWKK